MILRKPYAILIKNFKLIHLIISVFLCYLVYKTSAISSFFTSYIVSPIQLVDPSKVNSLTNLFLFIVPFLVIVGSSIIMVLMRFKKKPITFYFFTISISLLSIIYYTYASSILTTLEINLVDVRTLKLCQDFARTILIIQFLSAIVTIVRATGFNIRKFDFTKDLEELAIEEKDSEEFEVNVEVDSDKYKRLFRRFKRYARYIFIENKFILGIAFIIVCFVTGILIYLNITVFNKVYKVGETIHSTEFSITLMDAFTTEYDNKGIDEDNYSYIIIPFSVSRLTTNTQRLEIAKFYLSVADHIFYHDSSLNNSFADLGKGYNNENLLLTPEDRTFIFRVPTSFLKEKMYMVYNEGTTKYKYKINPTVLQKEDKVQEVHLNALLNLEDSILKKSSFKVETYEISYAFKESYTYCFATNECAPSSEYVIPTYSGRENKVLLKLTGTYEKDKDIKIEGVSTFSQFLEKFGTIEYSDAGEIHKIPTPLKFIKPSKANPKNTYYIECPSQIGVADSIWISFYIRGKQYKYIIK